MIRCVIINERGSFLLNTLIHTSQAKARSALMYRLKSYQSALLIE